MREIIDLHERVRARVGDAMPEEGVIFLRSEEVGNADLLPDDLRAEVDALRQQLDALVPADFDYLVCFGSPDDPPLFDLSFDEAPAGNIGGTKFDPARPVCDQLRSLDWEDQRARAREDAAHWSEIMRGIERVTTPLAPAKQFQRLFREEMKDFIKEKRRDASKIHVLYWHEVDDGLNELDFPAGDALRAALPGLVGGGAEIVTMVAGGKPLPVEKIDALKAAAIKVYGDQPLDGQEDEWDDDAIEVEAVEVESAPPAAETSAPESRGAGAEVPPDDAQGA